MASKKTSLGYSSLGASNDELLDELASFFYDAYQDDKEKRSDKIVPEKGQIAENEDDTKNWYCFNLVAGVSLAFRKLVQETPTNGIKAFVWTT